jgi:hypothetical protein
VGNVVTDGPKMTAGKSTSEASDRARTAAETHERRAAAARQLADNFSAGASGEREVAEALATLTASGWYILHDRAKPNGGNIDHVAIGPPGVVVIDAKAWTSAVEIKGERLFAAGRFRDRQVDGLVSQVHLVTTALSESHSTVAVRGLLVLTGEPDRARELTRVGDVRIIGVERLAPWLRSVSGSLGSASVETVMRRLSIDFPPAGHDTELAADSPVTLTTDARIQKRSFESGHLFVFLRSEVRRRDRVIVAENTDGETLGWRDANTGEVTLEDIGMIAPLVRAVLEKATPTGVQLTAPDCPRIPTTRPGGRVVFGWLGKMYLSPVIGHEWKRGAAHRLYGTLIDPADGVFSLGWVDLVTKKLLPASVGPLSVYRTDAESYLRLVYERWHQR